MDIPTDPNDPNYLADKNIHLVAELSNKNPFLNEAISVTYKLYVSSSILDILFTKLSFANGGF